MSSIGLLEDVRFAFRKQLKNPWVSATAVLALMLGIGANTVIFSVVYGLLLRPLPYPDSEALVKVWEQNLEEGSDRNVVSPANFFAWQEQNRVFDQLAAFYDLPYNLADVEQPEVLQGLRVSSGLLQMLGATPVLGSVFTPEQDVAGQEKVVMLSDRVWHRHFGRSPSVLGRRIKLNGEGHTIVGVLPKGFRFGDRHWDLWVPIAFGAEDRAFTGRFLRVLGRLEEGTALAKAQSEMDVIAERLVDEQPQANTGWGVLLVPLQDDLVGDVRPALLILLGAVGCVLLIACANVANLTLAQVAGRQKEIAIRVSLGAKRGRVVRQFLTESSLLALIGGAMALAFAWFGMQVLNRFAAAQLPILESGEIGLSAGLLAFTLAVTLGAGLISGCVPAWQAARSDPREFLKDGERNSTGAGHRIRSVFALAQIALSLVLLLGAGLLIRSFFVLQNVSLGLQTDRVMTMKVLLPPVSYPEPHQRTAFFDAVLERMAAVSGVQEVGGISYLPLSGLRSATTFVVEGRAAPPPGQEPHADIRVITPEYGRTLGIPLLKGRWFSSQDDAEKPGYALINQTLARSLWPDEDPIGQRLIYDWGEAIPVEVVGIVGDTRHSGPQETPAPAIYRPLRQKPQILMTLVARTETEPGHLAEVFAGLVQEVDPDQPVAEIRTMDQVLAQSVASTRFNMQLLGGFAFLALVLATTGIYAVMSYSVTQRRREMGIRMALGARRLDVLLLVLRHGLALTSIGLAAGLLVAVAVGRVLENLLFGISALDPLTFLLIPCLLGLMALLACAAPAYRAARVSPMTTLKAE
ncbi:MAG: ABC transporter permease [Acidobacteriota bacterium]